MSLKKTTVASVLIYGVAVAAGVFALEWLQYRYAVHAFTSEIYIGLIAAAFLVLGVFVGARLFGRGRQSTGPAVEAARIQLAVSESDRAAQAAVSQAAVKDLGISERELEVLTLIAEGLTNNEIGDRLCVSPNTVKTHAANLFRKLEVARRTQAVQRARVLGVIP